MGVVVSPDDKLRVSTEASRIETGLAIAIEAKAIIAPSGGMKIGTPNPRRRDTTFRELAVSGFIV